MSTGLKGADAVAYARWRRSLVNSAAVPEEHKRCPYGCGARIIRLVMRLMTSPERIYACGHAADGPDLEHLAFSDRELLRIERRVQEDLTRAIIAEYMTGWRPYVQLTSGKAA